MLVGMLTTTDNPWNPFDHWDEWYAWDSRFGYNTPGLLARFTHNSEELSEVGQQAITNAAIVEVVEQNYNGVLTAVWREVPHPYPDE